MNLNLRQMTVKLILLIPVEPQVVMMKLWLLLFLIILFNLPNFFFYKFQHVTMMIL